MNKNFTKKIKDNFTVRNFNNFVALLEEKQEFNCPVYSSNGGCACDGPNSYCASFGCKDVVINH